eukprot:3325881-Amphidinium_carterae.1
MADTDRFSGKRALNALLRRVPALTVAGINITSKAFLKMEPGTFRRRLFPLNYLAACYGEIVEPKGVLAESEFSMLMREPAESICLRARIAFGQPQASASHVWTLRPGMSIIRPKAFSRASKCSQGAVTCVLWLTRKLPKDLNFRRSLEPTAFHNTQKI